MKPSRGIPIQFFFQLKRLRCMRYCVTIMRYCVTIRDRKAYGLVAPIVIESIFVAITQRAQTRHTTGPNGPMESKMLVNVGKGIEREIDPDALPLFALNHAIMIGLRNILMDSHASITSELYPSESDRFVAS